VIAPGVVRAENPRNRLIIGRPDGQPDERLDTLASQLTSGGLEATVTPKIRGAIWAKLVMNLIGGSLGVLTASPMKDVLNNAAIAGTAKVMADEAVAIARALGCDPGVPTDGLEKLSTSNHLQSIAQDLLAGRPMEIDALLRVPLDLAELVKVATPNLDLMIELATQRARTAGLYQDTD
jgi:2-dehydropantoate 2-reductase